MPRLDFEASVVALLAGLRPGDVITYGEVAAEAGYPGAARAVGNLLRRTELPVPWWRVVAAGGRLSPYGRSEQARLLAAEGVEVTAAGRVAGMAQHRGGRS
ncbi:MAG: MGMT family protein [Actinobacteria bacterium]|nr:MGMT family protein [Actinomycetota bacterium]MBU1492343.1 MGMT family protein [Actinomycetota bacterium]